MKQGARKVRTPGPVASKPRPASPYPAWLRKAASKGGRKSRRKLSKTEARRIAAIRWGKKITKQKPKTTNE